MLESARADFYKKDIGLFKNKLGQPILSEKFSLTDITYKPNALAMDLFDGEGFVRENPEWPIINKGVFENLICDSRNAKKYNLKPTGNTQREFDTHGALGFNTIRLKPGSKNL